MSLLVGADDITSAFIYFLIAVCVMAVTMTALHYLVTSEMYRHFTNRANSDGEEREPLTSQELARESKKVFRIIWPLGLSVMFTFMVTLAVFPAVCVKIVSNSDNDMWSGTYFQPVLTFLLFNVGDYVGRQLAGSVLWVSTI